MLCQAQGFRDIPRLRKNELQTSPLLNALEQGLLGNFFHVMQSNASTRLQLQTFEV